MSVAKTPEQVRNERYKVGRIIKPGDPWSYFGKPEDLDPDWRVCLGEFVSPDDFPELFEKIGYKHGRRGDNFRLPLLAQEVVIPVGGESFFKSAPEYQDGYQKDAAAGYPIIRVR